MGTAPRHVDVPLWFQREGAALEAGYVT
jgi:hypothetical protein